MGRLESSSVVSFSFNPRSGRLASTTPSPRARSTSTQHRRAGRLGPTVRWKSTSQGELRMGRLFSIHRAGL